MDFVVVGLGLGALGVLLGLTLRDAAAWRWRVRADRTLAAGEVAARVAAARACRAGGRLLALGGAGVCLTTLLAILFRVSDRAGAALVLALLIVVTAGAIAWSAVYAHRYHPRPVRVRGASRPRRGVAEPTAEPVGGEQAVPPALAAEIVGGTGRNAEASAAVDPAVPATAPGTGDEEIGDIAAAMAETAPFVPAAEGAAANGSASPGAIEPAASEVAGAAAAADAADAPDAAEAADGAAAWPDDGAREPEEGGVSGPRAEASEASAHEPPPGPVPGDADGAGAAPRHVRERSLTIAGKAP